ncbi:MAG: metallophosphoesterase [Kiloniellales bacterium]|nr:metallophosphoesterase [Kiloniellales bacterium]
MLHQGDLDYRDDPDAWDDLITDELGADFPYFVSIGNHDVSRFFSPDGYQHKLRTRLRRIEDARCSGNLGMQSACTFRGLFFILSGIGTVPKRADDRKHVDFIREQLAQDTSLWRICSWHKTQRALQVGRKTDAVGWDAFEACRQGGAIIASGHEHTYSRTHLMDSFERLSVASTSSTLRIAKGRSFAFVSALGGKSIRDQDRDGPWWAAVYTSDQGANFGALFCTFFAGGEPDRASCYFKDIDGVVADRFAIVSEVR